jgi:ABC-type branched-subunit amino acid transport system ATPase component
MNRKILEVIDLNKSFGGLQAVKNFDFELFEGDRSAIIGPNGAGKTTLFNLLTGYHRADSGRILFDGIEITNYPSHRIANVGISRAFQITNIFPKLLIFLAGPLRLELKKPETYFISAAFTRDARYWQGNYPREIRKNLNWPWRYQANQSFCFWMSLRRVCPLKKRVKRWNLSIVSMKNLN